MNPLIFLPLLFMAGCKLGEFFKPHEIRCIEVPPSYPICPPPEECPKMPKCDHYVGPKVDLVLPDAGDHYLEPSPRGPLR